MKKTLVLVIIMLMSVGLMAQVRRIDPRRLPTQAIALISPANETVFRSVPVKITFRWRKTPGISQYTFVLETRSGNTWQAHMNRTNITADHVTINYEKPLDLRWRVTGISPRKVGYASPWWVMRYKGAVAGQGGTVSGGAVAGGHVKEKPKPKIVPVLMMPKGGVVLKNYPRTMTFTWLHSTKPGFRRYQIQVDIFHPNPGVWGSKLKGKGLLADTIVRENRFKYTFPADRIGRWRVRGVRNKRNVTPWSPWRKFSFRARH